MAKATWQGEVIAEAERFQTVEGNIYFPPDTVNREHLRDSTHTSLCPWKGVAHYYDVVVGEHVNPAAAWYYPNPKPAAASLKNYVGFWKGIVVET